MPCTKCGRDGDCADCCCVHQYHRAAERMPHLRRVDGCPSCGHGPVRAGT